MLSVSPTKNKPADDIKTRMDFVTYAADNYANWIEYWLESTSRSNPDARLWVYDVSKTPTLDLQHLTNRFANAYLVHWPPTKWKSPDWIEELDFQFFWPNFDLREELKYLSRRLRYKLTGYKKHDWMTDKKQHAAGKRWFLHLSCLKPHIIRDALLKSGRPVAFVDADAMVLKRLDHFPVSSADACVTVVDKDQLRIGGPWEPPGPDGPLPVTLINAGVLFLNNTAGASCLIDAWIQEIDRIRHGSGDQTALANLLHRLSPQFHEIMQPFSIATQCGKSLITPLPCALYNQVRLPRDGQTISNDVSIAHFVGSWKQPEHWATVKKTIHTTWDQRGLNKNTQNW